MELHPRPRFDWHLRTRTLALGERTLLMQIINLTPDSFSGDGLLSHRSDTTNETAITAAITALDNGADILDLGAESTRPNATPLTATEEQHRLLPVLEAILHQRPSAIVSVDTYHSETAQAALNAGAEIINDVSGLQWDNRMAAVVAASHCGLVLMHTRGRPQQWSSLPPLASDEVLPLVREGLRHQLNAAIAAGITAENIVLDPGFGFGKIGAENHTLLAHLNELSALERPLLVGLSRKRFLGESLLPTERLQATSAAHLIALRNGAHILRIHDLKAAQETVASLE